MRRSSAPAPTPASTTTPNGWPIFIQPSFAVRADSFFGRIAADAAVEILTALKGNSKPGKRDHIFAEPTGRPLSEKALRRACHRINPAISVHGMRSTFRDRVGDNTKFPLELAELALAHAIKGSAEAAYWRDDALERRRPMMEAWGQFCIPAKAAKVIPFAAA